MLHALSTVVLVARAHGLAVLDSSFREPNDPEGFRACCLESRELGFDGKAFMEPGLISIANEAFGPSAEEEDWARRVLAREAETPAGHAFFVDGRLIEPGHLDLARHVVRLARTIDGGDL
jgi:citrate lyase beta subunit